MGKLFRDIIMLALAALVLVAMYRERDAIVGLFRCMAMGAACGM
ncbi:MAG TPA: hypothetical protein VL524_10445 [Gemmatimonadaceae bacterium]|jgi:hypothetical protein|nr:hypothetical protein [Gemmatimonadaceae bacterium]